MARRWLPWLVLAVALVGALAVGTRDPGVERTPEQRAHDIALTVRCPMCEGQSAAASEAPSAVSLRRDIARRVAEGQTDDEIRSAYASSYGQRILMNPPSDGIAGLVWVLPVVVFVVAAAGLAFAFRRWSSRDGDAGAPTAADRDLVERARRSSAP